MSGKTPNALQVFKDKAKAAGARGEIDEAVLALKAVVADRSPHDPRLLGTLAFTFGVSDKGNNGAPLEIGVLAQRLSSKTPGAARALSAYMPK